MKTTHYFEEQVLRKRPYIQREWCAQVLREPARQVQPDGRIRFWAFIPELDKYLRVVTLEDDETVHNAFPDRDFEEVKSSSSIIIPKPIHSTLTCLREQA